MHPAYSVIVPVHNEAPTLRRTLPILSRATRDDTAEFIFVCNGCDDDSAQTVLAAGDPRFRVLVRDPPGKAAALDLGDMQATHWPRFFLDADVEVAPGVFRMLARALEQPGVEMVSPRVAFDLAGASVAARAVARVWLALPHGRTDAFHHLIGFNRAARRRWDRFPPVWGDDAFLCAVVPRGARRIVETCTVVTRPPSRLAAWVGVRTRWIVGERQLRCLGLRPQRTPGQAAGLLRLLRRREMAGPVLLFLLVRLVAEGAASLTGTGRWYRDRP